MYPGPLQLYGVTLATWNLLFVIGIVVGYCVIRPTFAAGVSVPRLLAVRYVICVWVCALGAQWFAYAFDANTTLFAPDGVNLWRYYFNPLAGPKTLFGAVLLLPIAAAVFVPFARLPYAIALDQSVPALFIILGFARVGCFLQGCCYGLATDRYGVRFPPGSSVHADQFLAGLTSLDQPSLPVLPVQLISAALCFSLALFSAQRLRDESRCVYLEAVAAYSACRFVLEFLRADPQRNSAGWLSTSQWIALLVFLLLTGVKIRRAPRLEVQNTIHK